LETGLTRKRPTARPRVHVLCPRSQPPPAKFEHVRPLRARTLHLLDCVPHECVQCKLDDLCTGLQLMREAFSLDEPALVHGVSRGVSRGCSPTVVQTEETKVEEVAAHEGALEIAKLVGEPSFDGCTPICASHHDSKPFHVTCDARDEAQLQRRR